jgi:hypothetical protein
MRRKRWLRWALLLVVVLFGGSEAFSRLLQTNAARRYLTGRLQSSFGRPVEVGGFDFSILDGPRIEILGVSVAEDPRFGNEYFLRAEKLTAGPRWSALLTGKFEFGTLSFTRPSLNLVRQPDDRWNLEGWLPPATSPKRGPSSSPGLPFHLARIEVDSGRVNFKQGNDVRPFALVDVTGYVQQEGPGRWSLDLEAEPMHAGFGKPQTGMLRVRGTIGGTTSRLQPAQLEMSWWGASLEDALRLIDGHDHGVRGSLAADLTAHVEGISAAGARAVGPPAPAQWDVTGTVWLGDAHRWDLPALTNAPRVNVSFAASWRQGERRVAFPKIQIVSPGSTAQGSAALDWNHGVQPHFELSSAEIGMSDLLSWYRAFRAGVDDDLAAQGSLRASGVLDGWPPRLINFSASSAGGNLSAGAGQRTLRWMPWQTTRLRNAVSSGPVAIQFVSSASNASASPLAPLTVQFDLLSSPEGFSSQPQRDDAFAAAPPHAPANHWAFRATLDGSAGRVEDWAWLLQEVGHPTTQMWSAEGMLAVHLKARGTLSPLAADWQGTVEARALRLQFAFLNQPLRFAQATYALSPAGRKLTLVSAEGLDATWSGTISRNAAGGDWQFDLTADRLDAAALDRWLGPRARPGFLARYFGPASDSGEEDEPPVPFKARGRLRAAQFTLGSLQLTELDADAEIAGRKIELPHAKADFFGGSVQGEFTASLADGPDYELHARFQRVNLSALAETVPALTGRLSGVVSGQLALRAKGVGHDALLTSLAGEGSLTARNAELQGFGFGSLSPILTADTDARYPEVEANFRIASRKVAATPLRLGRSGEGSSLATGTVDFNGVMELRVSPSQKGTAPEEAIAGGARSYRLFGTLADPEVGPLETAAAAASTPRGGLKSARP